jgi:hypothetical protein
VKLIYPKVFFNRGSPPKEIFFKDVFDGLIEEEGLKSILFDEVIRIQDRIERMEWDNNIRITPYKRALQISLLFIAIARSQLSKLLTTDADARKPSIK